MKWIKKIIRLIDLHPNIAGVIFSFSCCCILGGLLWHNPQILHEAGLFETIVFGGLIVLSVPFLFICAATIIAAIAFFFIGGIGLVVSLISSAWDKLVTWAWKD